MTVFPEITFVNADALKSISAITLLMLLVSKELVSTSDGGFARCLRRIFNIGVVPLLSAFVLTGVVKIVELL
jgi:hypothetical protein